MVFLFVDRPKKVLGIDDKLAKSFPTIPLLVPRFSLDTSAPSSCRFVQKFRKMKKKKTTNEGVKAHCIHSHVGKNASDV